MKRRCSEFNRISCCTVCIFLKCIHGQMSKIWCVFFSIFTARLRCRIHYFGFLLCCLRNQHVYCVAARCLCNRGFAERCFVVSFESNELLVSNGFREKIINFDTVLLRSSIQCGTMRVFPKSFF